MLPKTGNILRREFVIRKQPSRTYRLKDGRLQGCVDGREAVQQAIYCILNTERFDWLIYNWNYGVELTSLLGIPMKLAKSKIKKRIREALLQDDRIQSVDAFSFTIVGHKLSVTFTAHTQYGDVEASKEVDV